MKAARAYEDVEQPLREFRFLRGQPRRALEDFFNRLHEPYRTFARLRYQECMTMERIAEEMSYAPRTVYRFRRRVLDFFVIYQEGDRRHADRL